MQNLFLLFERNLCNTSLNRLSLLSSLGFLLSLLALLISKLLSLLRSSLLSLKSLELLQLLTTIRITPLLQLGSGDDGEQWRRGTELLVSGDDVEVEDVGDGWGRRQTELFEDGLGNGGHVRGNDTGENVDVVDGDVDDSVAALRLIGEQLVVETVLLEELVAERGDVENVSDTDTELGSLEMLDVGGEGFVGCLLVVGDEVVGIGG